MLPDFPYPVLDSLSDAVAVFDSGGQIVYSNAVFKSLGNRLSGPAKQETYSRLSNLVCDLRQEGERPVRKHGSISFGGKTFNVFIHSLEGPDRPGGSCLVIVKTCNREDAFDLSTSAETLLFSEALAPEFSKMKGDEPVFKKALITAQKAAKTDFPVLIIGESGTGKEILARTIHRASRRGRENFVDINCAAIPENLIESELFGYEKGAFTGADPKGRRGLFEEAHGGSIFLDEIGDASLQIQSKVLRVLEEGCFKRVGGNRNIKVNVRHISATNRDLTTSIKEGRFRGDLFYRLNTLTIKLPPLRMRPNDIPMLIEHFVTDYTRSEGKRVSFSADCLDLMESYSWPGNVRELKGVVDYALTMAADSLITPDCLPSFLLTQNDLKQPNSGKFPSGAVSIDKYGTLPAAVRNLEKELIKRVLARSASKSAAIKALGISRRTFYIKIKQYGLE